MCQIMADRGMTEMFLDKGIQRVLAAQRVVRGSVAA
jgi:hypothetical protein